MFSTTFLEQMQKFISFYNEVGRFIILTTSTIITLKENINFYGNNTWDRSGTLQASGVGCEDFRGTGK